MRKAFATLLMICVALILIAQERTLPSSTTYYVFDNNPLGQYYSYMSYTGGTSDYLLPTTRDSIAFQYDTKASSPYDLDLTMTYNLIVGTDTTVTLLLQGRNSLNADWTTISTNVSSVISGQIVQSVSNGKTATIASHTNVGTAFNVQYLQSTDTIYQYPAITFTEGAQTITYADKLRYRYIRVLCIITGNDSVGTGVKITKAELKLWK